MITIDALIGINKLVSLQSGSRCIIINEINLLSALSVQQWYPDKPLLSAALIRSVIIAHGFQDGNKRTAAILGATILDYECTEDEMIECILSIAKGDLKDVQEIASILYPQSTKP